MSRLWRWLSTRTEVVAKPGVGEIHLTYRRWSGRITDVVVRPEGHEPRPRIRIVESSLDAYIQRHLEPGRKTGGRKLGPSSRRVA